MSATYSLGWIPDCPDFRDYTEKTAEVREILRGTGLPGGKSGKGKKHIAPAVDHIDTSRLFLLKVTRNLMKVQGDTGAYLRGTIGAMVLFGVPPEEYWAYADHPDRFDKGLAEDFWTVLKKNGSIPESSGFEPSRRAGESFSSQRMSGHGYESKRDRRR